MPEPLRGSCLCGAIRYTVSAEVKELRACHCTHCQKASGAGGTVNAVVPSEAFELTQGKPKRIDTKADSGRTLHRYFCGDCGSAIYSQRETNPALMVVRAGTFDNAGPMKIATHIWTKSAPSWAHLDPAAQQIPGQP